NDLPGDLGWDLLVCLQLHGRVRGPALCPGPQVGGVAEQLGQRNQHPDGPHSGSFVDVLDPTTAGRHVAEDVTHELLGRQDLELHDRLEEYGVRLANPVTQGHLAGDLEGDLGRVHVVVGPVDQHGPDVHHGVPGQHARL